MKNLGFFTLAKLLFFVEDAKFGSFAKLGLSVGICGFSTDKEPMVHYTSFGKRYVSVEMWLRGDSINRVGDTIDVQPSPHVSLPSDTLLCSGESILLGASQGFHADYLWSTGSTDSTLTVSQSGAS